MKSLSLLILTIPFIIPCYCPGQSVTSVALSAGSPSHGSANITFSYSGAPSSFRFRLAQAPATCTGGTGGYVVGSTSSNYQIRNNPQQANVGGLTSSTTYQVCPEITSDGNTWFGGKGVTFTTLPLPNPHPAAPVAPVSFNTNYPDTTGYQVYNLNSACVDSATGNSLQQDILTALANQVTSGAVINIAAGAVCRGQIYLSQLAADLITVQSSSVCPASGTSCTPNSINVAHNFVEGDIAVFGVFADQIGGGAGLPTGILRGQNYYVHVLDSTHFQLTFALPYSMGGSIVPIQDQGFRNFYYYRRFNVVPGVTYGQRALHWIIIRPSTPDNQFVPEHTRLEGPLDASGHPTPPTNWLAKMYTLTMANKYDGFAADNMLFSVSDGDGNFMSMNGYIRIVGAHFTFDPSADSAGGKPMAHYRLFNSNPWNSDIIIDRSWFNPPAAPDENSGLIGFDGTNMAMVDSYSNNFKYYHATYSGMGVSIASANSISIGAGTYNFGSGKVTFPSPVTCTTTGTISVANDAYIYFTAATKTLVITLPPGISGRSCTGYSPYQFVTLSNLGNGLYNSSHGFPNATGGTPALYWVDPIYSVDGTQANQQSLWMNNPEPNSDPNKLAGIQFFGSAAELGTRFQMTANGSIIGVRFWKDPRDVGTHTGTLWSDSGTLLATGTFSNETASGWQTLYFSSPVSVTSGLFYRISYFAPTGCTFNDYFYRNGAMFNGNVPMIAPGLASATTNSWDWTARWPAYWTARPNVGYLGAFAYQNIGTGTITAVANADVYDDSINTEGCQCVLAGNGPGPFVVKDNYFEGSGNIWHFDDGGGYNLSRHDYTVYRNWFYSPLSQMFTADGMNAASDGMQYGHRHALEWKQGNCGAIIGNIFDTSWVESTPFGDLFEISGINGAPGVCGVSNQIIYGATSDFDIRSNMFEHAASVNSVFGPTPGSIPAFPQRFRFTNNLMVDINGTTYCALGAGFCSSYSYGSGLIFQTSQMQDFTMTHNTMIGNNAGSRLPFLFLSAVSNQEGFNIRDNILWINGLSGGSDGTSNDTCGYTSGTDGGCWGTGTYCKNLTGIAAFNCAYINSTWLNNVITGSPTQSQIQSLWPNNIVPASPSNLNGIGWFNYTSPSVVGNYNLKSTSSYISGGTNPATDRLSIGVDYDQLQADQGYVTMGGVSNITSSSAQINFVAPDSQSCPIDYSPTDSTVTDNSLIRVPDTGTGRTRNVTITGLSSSQIYYFRINCAVNQPLGQFKTH